MNRRSFLLGTAAVVIAPVVPAVAAPARAVGFNPLLAAPYANGGFITGEAYRAAKAIAYARAYSCGPAVSRVMMERAAALTHCDYAGMEARVLAYEAGVRGYGRQQWSVDR